MTSSCNYSASTVERTQILGCLARASFQELRQFLQRPKAEAVIAALSMSAIAETEHARSEKLDNPESIYRACADMKLFNQEVLRVILLDTRYRYISTVEITKLARFTDGCVATL